VGGRPSRDGLTSAANIRSLLERVSEEDLRIPAGVKHEDINVLLDICEQLRSADGAQRLHSNFSLPEFLGGYMRLTGPAEDRDVVATEFLVRLISGIVDSLRQRVQKIQVVAGQQTQVMEQLTKLSQHRRRTTTERTVLSLLSKSFSKQRSLCAAILDRFWQKTRQRWRVDARERASLYATLEAVQRGLAEVQQVMMTPATFSSSQRARERSARLRHAASELVTQQP